MNFLLDTNVLSELKKRQPDRAVEAWIAAQPANRLYLSVLTLGELRKGIEALPEGERKASFSAWLNQELPGYFAGRILGIDVRVADRWGSLCAAAGRPLPAIDSLLAATALEHGMVLVTRNEMDFRLAGIKICNPWNTGV